MEEKILVSPGEGQTLEDVAKALIELADDPHDVEYTPRQGGFFVPETLAGRYAFTADSAASAEVSAEPAKAPRARRSRSAPAKGEKAGAARTRKGASKASPAAVKPQAKGGKKGDEGGVSDA